MITLQIKSILLHVFFLHCRSFFTWCSVFWKIFVWEIHAMLVCRSKAWLFTRIKYSKIILSGYFQKQLMVADSDFSFWLLPFYFVNNQRYHVPIQYDSIWATVCWHFILILFRWYWVDETWLRNLDYLFTNDSFNMTFLFVYLIDYQGIFLTLYLCNFLLYQGNE